MRLSRRDLLAGGALIAVTTAASPLLFNRGSGGLLLVHDDQLAADRLTLKLQPARLAEARIALLTRDGFEAANKLITARSGRVLALVSDGAAPVAEALLRKRGVRTLGEARFAGRVLITAELLERRDG